jgi:anti-sigma factor RsiW
MKCYRIKRILPLFLDDRLSEKQSAEVKIHLDKCPLCAKESESLKETWDLLAEWRPIHPAPNFKARFWQRVAEEASQERQPIFVLPRLLSPRLVPTFATLGIILIIGIYLMNFFAGASVQHLAKLTGNQDIQMLKDLDLTQDFEVIQNINILEDFEIINSLEL